DERLRRLERRMGAVEEAVRGVSTRLDETNARLDQAVDVLTRLVQVVAAQNDRMNRNFERLNGRIDRLSKAILARRTADLKRFSLERLRQILPRMLASGTLQVGLTVGATAVVFTGLGTAWPAAVFIGFLVSLSSPAIVFKLYEEDGEIDAPQGQAAAGILLFQDLALVPMMLLVPVLARPGQAGV